MGLVNLMKNAIHVLFLSSNWQSNLNDPLGKTASSSKKLD